ncbi:MAG: sodium/solute symporter [Dechloromonas sp.]|nr:MAG: sodium/solute symporter [Dechloromonas sp.]
MKNTWLLISLIMIGAVWAPVATGQHSDRSATGSLITSSAEVSDALNATPSRKGFGWLDYAALGFYLAAMVGIGWYCSRRNKNTDDYFKAAGRIPWWAAGLSIYATMLSSITFMAIPAKAYATDWTYFWASLPILLLAPVIIRLYLPFYRRLNITSAYEYLELRFNLLARLYGSASFIMFQIGRQAIVLLLPALALATVSELEVGLCITIMGVLCVIYTVMGGVEAVVWTDVAQIGVLVGAAVVSLVLIVYGADGTGVGQFFVVANNADKFHMFNWTLNPDAKTNAFWVILIGNFFINLVPYTSDQAVVQRYMTTKDEAMAARAIWLNGLIALPSTALFFSIGTALFVFYRVHPEKLASSQVTDAIFPAFIVQNLPMGIAGLVIAGIFAAAQSTVSGSLNSVTTVIMTDYCRRFGFLTDKVRSLRSARLITGGLGMFATCAALILAKTGLQSLWDAYNSLVGLVGSGLAGLFALGIFSRRANGTGAMIGALASAIVLYLVQQNTNLHFFLYAAVGIITCVWVGWLASLCFPSPARQDLKGLTIFR